MMSKIFPRNEIVSPDGCALFILERRFARSISLVLENYQGSHTIYILFLRRKQKEDKLRIRRKRSSSVVVFSIATSVLDSWFQLVVTFSTLLSTSRKIY